MRKFNYLLAPALFAIALTAPKAFAHSGHRDFENRDREISKKVYEHIKNFKPRFEQKRKPKTIGKLTTVACGDIIESSITVANDLNCPDVRGFALRVSGNNIVINGNGKKISAPNAAAGIYVEGDGNTVANYNVQGVSNGYGVLAYNASYVNLLNNNFSRNLIGMMIYADNGDLLHPLIANNTSTNNSFAGLRTYSDEPGQIIDPIIIRNDFRSSGEFAVYLKVESATLSENELTKNLVAGSNNGYYLKSGTFKVKNMDLSKQLINKRHFFVYNAKSISFENVDVSSIAPRSLNQDRMAIDLYRVEKFKMKNVKAFNNDVGLKLETENGVSTEGSLTDCKFSNQSFAGSHIVSYDNTAYGTIKIISSKPELVSSVGKVVVDPNTIANIVYETKKKGRDNDDDDDCDRD